MGKAVYRRKSLFGFTIPRNKSMSWWKSKRVLGMVAGAET